MHRHRVIFSFLLIMAFTGSLVGLSAESKVGFGVKAPMELFVAYRPAPRLLLEAGVIGPFIGPITGMALRLDLKLFLRPLKLLEYPVTPFLGGGVAVASAAQMGSITGFQALGGLELALKGTPLSAFAELGYHFVNVSHLAVGIFVPAIGVRFDL